MGHSFQTGAYSGGGGLKVNFEQFIIHFPVLRFQNDPTSPQKIPRYVSAFKSHGYAPGSLTFQQKPSSFLKKY